jgi:hypothetical protein
VVAHEEGQARQGARALPFAFLSCLECPADVAQAFGSFLRLRAHPLIAARDFYYSYVIYQEEIKEARGANYFSRLKNCFTVRFAFSAIFF